MKKSLFISTTILIIALVQLVFAGTGSSTLARLNWYFFKNASADRDFHIDFNGNTFVKDGKPFRYISGTIFYMKKHYNLQPWKNWKIEMQGSIHPYRVPKELWEDRLKKMYAALFFTLEMYAFSKKVFQVRCRFECNWNVSIQLG